MKSDDPQVSPPVLATPRPSRARAARWLRRLAAVLLGVALGLLASEGLLRFLLFSDTSLARSLGGHMRQSQKYVAPKSNSDYFKLRYQWQDFEGPLEAHYRQPDIGWVSSLVDLENLDHQDRGLLGDRRPVLMYGDSYTACTVKPQDCWQGLMRRSARREDLALMNYGTRGHGIGQVYLMLKHSLERWLPLDPIVIIGILVDDDLDRTVFDFRSAPKPLFEMDGENLIVTSPGDTTIEEWLEENPVKIRSYLYAYLRLKPGLFRGSWRVKKTESPEAIEEKKLIARSLLRDMQAELQRHELDYFFCVFEGPRVMSSRKNRQGNWRHSFLYECLSDLDIPWVSAERELMVDLRQNEDRERSGYFIPEGQPGGRHFNALGNKVAFRAIMKGIDGEFEQKRVARPPGDAKKPAKDPAKKKRKRKKKNE